jgi:hypothetical protein
MAYRTAARSLGGLVTMNMHRLPASPILQPSVLGHLHAKKRGEDVLLDLVVEVVHQPVS